MPDTDRVYSVLFLCTANSARSIIAESICNADWPRRLHGLSAGSHPAGTINPRALALLRRLGHDIPALRSKDWAEFAGDGAPRMDFVFTLCDDAAGEVCPVWPGRPVTAHWGLPDPAKAAGSEAEIALAFDRTYAALARRIGIFASLPIATLDRMALTRAVREIGEDAAVTVAQSGPDG